MAPIDRTSFALGLDSGAPPALGDGWAAPNPVDTWTAGPRATLLLPTPAQAVDHFLILRLRTTHNAAQQRVGLAVRGTEIARFTLAGNTSRACRVPAALLGGDASLPVTLLIEDKPVALRSIALQPDIAAVSPPPADADPSDRAMMLRFESLGENCEFGLAQRAAGAEPLGLMRFASTNLQRLLTALDNGFAGIGAPDKLRVEVSSNGREYMVTDLVFGLHYHAWVKTEEMAAEDVHRREVRRMPFLIRKLTEDLQAGHKIFVRKERGGEPEEEIYPLVPALRRWGPNKLLYVTLADATHPPGSVERREAGFLVGYVERFAPGEDAHDFLADQWLAMCRAAQALVWPELAGMSVDATTAPPVTVTPMPLLSPGLAPRPERPALSCRLALRLQNGGYVDSGGPMQSYASLHQLETPPFWARLIFFNDRSEPHRIDGAAIAATSAVGDEVTPQETADTAIWRQVTFTAGGQDSDPLDPPEGNATVLDMPACPHGAGRPLRMLSDWVPLSGVGRTDGGAGALLMVRSFAAGRQRYSGCAGKPDPAIGRLHAGFWAPGDTTARPWHGNWNRFDGLFASYGLQYVSAVPGATVVGIGDNVMLGPATTGGLSSFGLRACALVSRPELPVSWFNEGYNGRTSRDFARAGGWAIGTLRPQVTLIQTWSENDPHTVEAAEMALSRAMALADATRRHGGVPVLVTAAPVFAGNTAGEAVRQHSLARVRDCARLGYATLDLDAIWGNGSRPNAYQPVFDSGDHRHQNDAGCAAAAAVLATVLADLLGLA